jgi:hypothetical protein
MPDFTFHTFRLLLATLKDRQYTFQTFTGFLSHPAPRVVILRHDVDARKLNSLRAAEMEAGMGIAGTYNFRIVPESFDAGVIRQIAALGHEIGYHYEDLALAGGDFQMAIRLFGENLARLRQVAPVETICMHGSPLSRFDNRRLWEKYSYRDFGITGEPYFDLDFSSMLYLTDTGRRWDGENVSIRDKMIKQNNRVREIKTNKSVMTEADPGTSLPKGQGEQQGRSMPAPFRTTFDIIRALQDNLLPDQIMINVHPQRWENRPLPWLREFVFQNGKNLVKRLLVNFNKPASGLIL